MTTTTHDVLALDQVADLSAQLRVDSIRSSTAAGSGHPTSSLSAADLLAVLVARHLRYDWDDPDAPGNDHLIFSKGHASPLLYSVYRAVGVVPEQELLEGYRRFGERLEGHPTPILPWVDVATGSLGQALEMIVRLLEELGYLRGDELTADGRMLARIWGESDLVVAECLRRGTWAGASGPALAAAVATAGGSDSSAGSRP